MIVASQGTSQLVSGANVLESSIASNTAAITGGLPVAELTPVAVTTVVSTRECEKRWEPSPSRDWMHIGDGIVSYLSPSQPAKPLPCSNRLRVPTAVVVVGFVELSPLTSVTWRLNSTHLACQVVHKEQSWCVIGATMLHSGIIGAVGREDGGE